MSQLTASEIRAYLERDWSLLERSKRELWIERIGRLGLAEALRVGDELARIGRASRPDWPSEAERAEDLETHRRVAEMLARVPRSER